MASTIINEQSLEIIKQKCLELLYVLVDLCEKNNITYWLDGGTLLGAVRNGHMIPWDDDIDVCFPADDHQRILQILDEFSQQNNPYFVYFYKSRFSYAHDYFGDSTTIVDGVFPVHIDLVCVKYVENTPETIQIDNSWANIASIFLLGEAKHPHRIIPVHQQFVPSGKDIVMENQLFFKSYRKYMMNNALLPPSDDLKMYYSSNDFLVKRDRPHFDFSVLFPLTQIEFEGKLFNAPKDIHAYLVHLYGENYRQLPPVEEQVSHGHFLSYSQKSKKKWKEFITDFHISGMKNLAIGKSNKRFWRPFFKIQTLLSMTFKWIVRGDFEMAKGLIKYSIEKLKRS